MPERELIQIGRLKVKVGSLPSNHHGPRCECGRAPTLIRTWSVVTLAPHVPGVWARRLWVYGGEGQCIHLDLYWTYDAPALAAYRAADRAAGW